MDNNRLSEFLRARRALVRPEDHGMPAGARRTPGLRREEVAVLAGVSTDYYVRLEQGRERNPSPQVLRALAAALLLTDEEAAYLRAAVDPPQRSRSRPAREYAGPQLVSLLDAWADTPALVYGRYLDLLAVNSLGEALFSWLGSRSSLITAMFLDPAARDFYRDWAVVAQGCVAALRAANPAPDDQRLQELVGELSVRSTDFARMWARHEVRAKTASAKRFRHPLVGDLTLDFETFSVHSAPGQHLVVYRAEPGSSAAQSLSLLDSLALTEIHDVQDEGHIPHELP
ncbi:Transcriptional regulator, contains XRE-family HTH domain [Streptomyces misionensis]|uniref:Transcriptional regulator, contains XRE-family HTH domain n=1 Tax=Streptomyces misionensis TaxID=67331 RepID=A0A1H4M6N8_9ACTN|nr:helix-turn-helix transcriptional regulator [Streptomyces misionensis]SEB78676.1 Transcriptional regulator, contains XRE-family HTH domain [Streptomyces misionensis]